jgi:hypothetical protein
VRNRGSIESEVLTISISVYFAMSPAGMSSLELTVTSSDLRSNTAGSSASLVAVLPSSVKIGGCSQIEAFNIYPHGTPQSAHGQGA